MIATEKVLWENVTDDLISYIKQNDFSKNRRFFTTEEISRKYNVSNITSRRVINELAEHGYIEKYRGRGCFVKCTIKDEIYILMLSDRHVMDYFSKSPIMLEFLRGIRQMSIVNRDAISLITPSQLLKIKAKRPLGVIIIQNLPNDRSEEIIELLSRDDVYSVFCHVAEPATWTSTVRADYRMAGRLVAEHLIGKGHKTFGWLGSKSQWQSSSVAQRFEGFFNTLTQCGLKCNPGWMLELPLERATAELELSRAFLGTDRPSAIFASNDENALTLMNFCFERGIRVPQDMAIVGFDNLPIAGMTVPPLTTVDTFWKRQAEKSVELLSEMMAQRKKIIENVVIAPELIERKTT